MKKINILEDKGFDLSQEERQLLKKLKLEKGNNFFSNEFILDNGEVFDPKLATDRFMIRMYERKYTIEKFTDMFMRSFRDSKTGNEEKIILIEMYIKTNINNEIDITWNYCRENARHIFKHLSKTIKKRKEIFDDFKRAEDKKKFLEWISKNYFTVDFFKNVLIYIKNKPTLLETTLRKWEHLIYNNEFIFTSALGLVKDKPNLLEEIIEKGKNLIKDNEKAFASTIKYAKNNPELLKKLLEIGKNLTFTNDQAFFRTIKYTKNNPKLLEIILEKGEKLNFYNHEAFNNALMFSKNNPDLIELIIKKGEELISTNQFAFVSALNYTQNIPNLSKTVIEKGEKIDINNETIFSFGLMEFKNQPKLLAIIIEKWRKLTFNDKNAFSISLKAVQDNPKLLKIIIEQWKELISNNQEIFTSTLWYTKNYINIAKTVIEQWKGLISNNQWVFLSTLKAIKNNPELLEQISTLDYKLIFNFEDSFVYALVYAKNNNKLVEMLINSWKELISNNAGAFIYALIYTENNPKLLEQIILNWIELITKDELTFFSVLECTKDDSKILKIAIKQYEQSTNINKKMIAYALEYTKHNYKLFKLVIKKSSKLIFTDKKLFGKILEYTKEYPELRLSIFELWKKYIIKKENIIQYIKTKKYQEFEKIYLDLIQKNLQIGRNGRIINLWQWYETLKPYFKDDNNWQIFIKKIIIQNTKNISQSINDIYDYYNEKDYTYPKIKKEIKKWLKFYSTEELISSLWNQITNYTTTFKLILNEIQNRLWSKNIFEYIDNNNNLNQITKDFSIWQIIIGLSARWEVNKLLTYIWRYSNKEKVWTIIKNILHYKENNIFSRESYVGLLLWIEDLLKNDNTWFINSIIENYFNEDNTDISFKKSLIVIFDIKRNIKLLKKYLWENYKENKLYQEIVWTKKQSILNPKLFEKWTSKDFVYIYGWNSHGWWTEFFEKDINVYLNKYEGYSILWPNDIDRNNLSKSKYVILEKDWINIVFINYEKENNIDKIVKKEWLDILWISYRWHNSYTREMIKNTPDFLDNNKDAFVIDGGCNNSSYIETYRANGVMNQLITYDSTGRWAVTIKLMQILIEYIRDNKGKEINITWQDFNDKIIGQRIDEESRYAHKYIKFPWNMIDILLKLESEKM